MRGATVACAWLVGASAACVPSTVPPNNPVQEPRLFRMDPLAQCDGANDTPEVVGALGDEALVEASGVVASPTNADVLWLHNDAGDEARVFAVSAAPGAEGAPLGSLALPGVEARDFEDIAAAPCPDLLAACLYVCDCGDNDEERAEIVVYAIPEPAVSLDAPILPNSAAQVVWAFPVAAPDGPVNVEAFVVLPDATAMIFFEKKRDEARVLRLPAPWTPDTRAELQVANRITAPGPDIEDFGVITGASLHPSGERLLLRTYVGAFEARVPASGLGAAGLDGEDFVELFRSPEGEPQGEAIAYDAAGTGIWTVSESPERAPNPPLHHTACR